MKYKKNWEETKEKWTNYWKHQNTGRPLMMVVARNPEIETFAEQKAVEGIMCQGRLYNLPENLKSTNLPVEEKYTNAELIVNRYRHFCETHEFLGESFPNLNVDFGPGSLATYIGAGLEFKPDTVWFKPTVEEWEDTPKLSFDAENENFKKHIALIKKCRELAGDDFYIDMPDLMENLDTLASLRGSQEVLMDMMEDPDEILKRVKEVDDLYYEYFDRFYDVIKDKDGASAYTIFQIWGPGRCVKLQCDISAMISPDNFREFVQESLRQQAEKADQVLYHLDGPQAIRHLDALMEIDGIDALQWTSGDAGPDGTLEDWDVIYDKAIAAGKSLWVKVYSGSFEDWIKNVERLVMKYGSHSIFFMFPEMSKEQADYLLDYADKNWSDIKGSYVESLGVNS